MYVKGPRAAHVWRDRQEPDPRRIEAQQPSREAAVDSWSRSGGAGSTRAPSDGPPAGWDRIGILNPAHASGLIEDQAFGKIRGAKLEGVLGTAGSWGSIDRGFSGNWELDVTAALLSGVRRL